MASDVRHAHQLLDQLAPNQPAAVVHLLETIVSHEEDRDSLRNSERKAIGEADEWLTQNRPISHENVLAELGVTSADWDKMAEEPLPQEAPRHRG